MSKHIVNSNNVEWVSWSEGGPEGNSFEGKCKRLGHAAQGRQLGCSLIQVPPGKKAWPAHYHLANEEAIWIIRGKGHMRMGDQEYPVGPGSYIAMPAEQGLAHQLRNTGEDVLEYLCMSTMLEPEVVGYPDSDKVGVITGSAPGGPQERRTITAFFPQDANVNYWKDES